MPIGLLLEGDGGTGSGNNSTMMTVLHAMMLLKLICVLECIITTSLIMALPDSQFFSPDISL